MKYLAVNKNGQEVACNSAPFRGYYSSWVNGESHDLDVENGTVIWTSTSKIHYLQKGTIEMLTGRKLTWENDYIALKFDIKQVLNVCTK